MSDSHFSPLEGWWQLWEGTKDGAEAWADKKIPGLPSAWPEGALS